LQSRKRLGGRAPDAARPHDNIDCIRSVIRF
jgi:hypothetical protein